MRLDPIVSQINKANWDEWRAPLKVLFEHSFGRDLSSNYLDWRYVNNELDLFFSVIGDTNSLLASYSVGPIRLVNNSNSYSTGISMTTMTHPVARGKGYFPVIAKDVYLRLANHGASLVWGFMNSVSHRIFIRDLGWSDIYEIPTLTLDLTWQSESINDGVLRVSEDSLFILEYQPIDYGKFIRTERTSDFLKWRYLNHPINSYNNFVIQNNGKVVSHIVTKNYEENIDLVDIQVSCEADAVDLINFVIQKSLRDQRKSISCWASVHHFVHGILERMGFINSGPVTYFGGRELIEGASPSGWRSFDNWYIQMGDSDVF